MLLDVQRVLLDVSAGFQSFMTCTLLSQVKVMTALEKQLDKAGGRFITGSRMTMADFVLFSEMQDLKVLRLESGDYPRHGGPRPILGHQFLTHFLKTG